MKNPLKSIFGNNQNPGKPFDLEKEILHFKGTDPKMNKDTYALKIKDLICGTVIFGATGSGKTSASGHKYLLECFKNGFGALCCTVKIQDAQEIFEIVKLAGRENDVVFFSPNNNISFNPLAFELKRVKKTGDIENLLQLLTRVNELIFPNSDKGEDKAFWQTALSRLLDRSINLLLLAVEEVSIANINKIILSASAEHVIINQINTYHDLIHAMPDASPEEQDLIAGELLQLGKANYMLHCIMKAEMSENLDEESIELCRQYFFQQFLFLADKTKSSVTEMGYGMVEYFIKKGFIKKFFTGTTDESLNPENTWLKGSIIILDFPIKEHDMIGKLAQNIYRFYFMQCAERRVVDYSGNHRPVLLYQDEFHLTMNPTYDDKFQSTCRSSLIATVSITQNINNLFVAMGSEDKALSILGNMNTKIFHGNDNDATNQYASKLFSEDIQEKISRTISDSPSKNITEEYLPQIRPIEMTRLKNGGESNDWIVEGFISNGSKYHAWKKTNVIKCEIEQLNIQH